MISCLTFKKRLNEFIYNSITDDLKTSMEDHIQNCEPCQTLYEEELQIDKAFKDVINIRNINFNSSRDDIIKGIDKNRYNRSFSNKLFYKFRRNILAYAVSAILFFSISSGGFYYYNLYINNPEKQIIAITSVDIINGIEDYKQFEEPLQKVETLNTSYLETKLPIPTDSNNKKVQEVLGKIQKETHSGNPWIFGYADFNRIIFYNHSALLAYSYNDGKPKFYSGIDLEKIDVGYMQGPIHTDFNFSPNGDYVVINNGIEEYNLQSNKYNMYLHSFKSGEMRIISNENNFLIVDSWSSTSNFYAFGDKNGERIFIHDLLSGTSLTLPFNKGNINNIFVSDYGDIIVESSINLNGVTTFEKYIFQKDNFYEVEQYLLPGIIIGMRENKVLYYDQNTIYELISGKSNPVEKLGAGFNIQKIDKRYVSFSDGMCTFIYDYNRGFSKYYTSYNQDYSMELSLDLKKSVLLNYNNARVMYSDNIKDAIEIGYYDNFSSNYTWFDNSNLIRISQVNGSDKLGDFELYKIDISPSKSKLTSKSKIDIQQKEKYAPGILIEASNTNNLEKANIILRNYFETLKNQASPDSLHIKDYKIKVIKVEHKNTDGLLLSVECSILPYENYVPPQGKSKNKDGWYNNMYYSISVFSEDNIYYIDNISAST